MRHNFRKLQVWEKSIEIVDSVYSFCENLPSDERFGLISQIKRSAVSIPSNIAEGCAKRSDKHFAEMLSTSLGSAYELETQLIICKRRNLGENTDLLIDQLQDIQKMIYSFRSQLTVFTLCSIFFALFS